MYCILYTTCPNEDVASAIAEALVTGRLAACCNYFPLMRSVYFWEGRLQHDEETAVIFKTTEAAAPEAIARIVQLHPYELPAVVQVPVEGGHGPFLDWISRQVGGDTDAAGEQGPQQPGTGGSKP